MRTQRKKLQSAPQLESMLRILLSVALAIPPVPAAWAEPDQPPPSDASDFEDGDADFGQNGNAPSFGFNPPPNQNSNPNNPGMQGDMGAPPDVPAPTEMTPPSSQPRFTPPSVPSRPRNSRASNRGTGVNPNPSTPTGATGPGKPNGKTAMKAAPKLADYLELDSSIKGLEVKNFDLPDKDIKDVVLLMSKWTGKNFILDQKVRGKITIIGPSQVTLQEAYQAFLSALEANGLTTIQSGKFIRIIESAEARRAPVKLYSGDFAPKDDQFITRVLQLKYINADEVQREFRDLTTRQGKLFAYEPTNSIIVTDTGSNIQRIKELLDALDVKSFESTLHVLKVKNGSAKSIADMLANIYGDTRTGATGGAPRSFRRSALERTRGGGIISKILPDEQTNSLVVLANQAGFQQLKQLVARLDQKTGDTGRVHVYYCEHAKAEDLAATLASLAGTGGGAGARRSSPRGATPSGGAPGQANPLGGASSVSSAPVTAELGDGVKITADPPTNSLVITANSADYQSLKRVIRKLDIPRQQVFVETAILEVSLDNKDNWGVNHAVFTDKFAGAFLGDSKNLLTLFQKSGLPEGVTIPIALGNPSTQNILGQQLSVTPFMSLLNLITTNSKTSVLSTPQIIALDNEKAEFQVQDNIPVIGSTTAATTTAGPIQNVETKKVGIDIKLTPHINAASRIVRLEIEQQVDNIKTMELGALQGQNIATTSRKTTTAVVVKDGDFVALGGLMSDKVDETHKKVPLLGDIPVLGWLFKSRTHQVIKTNLIILLRPKIIGTTLASAEAIDDQMQRRNEFIKREFSGSDPHEEEMNIYKQKIEDQKNRAQSETPFDYRNNQDEEDDDDKTAKNEPKPAKRELPPSKEEPALLTPPGEAITEPKETP